MKRFKTQTKAKTEKELFDQAFRAALRVEFITTVPELRLYTANLFEAMKWGQAQTR